MTPFIDVYKAKMQYDGILDKLKLRIVVRGYLQNKELVGDTWSPTASMRNLKYFLADAVKHKARSISKSSWNMLVNKCLQLVPYFADNF